MKVAIYSLTRDRLAYSKKAFSSLLANAGCAFDHFVVDNGSTDGTLDWLKEDYLPMKLISFNQNMGISVASNAALEEIQKQGPYDVIAKFDNDAKLISYGAINALAKLVLEREAVLSPTVVGINRQPKRVGFTQVQGTQIGVTSIVGGLCHVVNASLYKRYRYPEDLALAHGQDDNFCQWAKTQRALVGYVESYIVEHIDGTDNQALKYPEYFQRKWREERLKPEAVKVD